MFGDSMSAVEDAKASHRGSLGGAIACGAGASTAIVNLSVLLFRFATGSCITDDASSGWDAGTPTRPKILVAAAPKTRKPTSAMIVRARVKPFSVCIDEPR